MIDKPTPKQRPGRPPLNAERMVSVTVSLPAWLVAELRADPDGISAALRKRLGV